jgi:transcriptional regulator with XRE-family HTH domain
MGKRNAYDRQLAKKRRMLGLTQHQVSRLTGISLNRLVYAETGRTELSPEERERCMSLFRQVLQKVVALVA